MGGADALGLKNECHRMGVLPRRQKRLLRKRTSFYNNGAAWEQFLAHRQERC